MMRFTRAAALALTMASGSLLAGPASAGFLGHTVEVNYALPTTGDIYFPGGTAVVGPGLEFPDLSGVNLEADFTDNSILFTYPAGITLAGGPVAFNGWVATDLTAADITGVSLLGTNIAGITASNLSFDGNHVYVNTVHLVGETLASGSYISVGVTFAGVVPEPTTWALMILGFGGVGGVLRRRPGAAFR